MESIPKRPEAARDEESAAIDRELRELRAELEAIEVGLAEYRREHLEEMEAQFGRRRHRVMILDAPAEYLRDWLADWGTRSGVFVASTETWAKHVGWDDDKNAWWLDFQVLPLSPTRTELRIRWTRSPAEKPHLQKSVGG
jgi:hypothetical protein